MMKQPKRMWCLLAGLWMFAACGGCSIVKHGDSEAEAPQSTALTIPHPTLDQHASTTSIRYAKGFTLEQRQGYRLMRVLTPWRDAKTTFSYALVRRGEKIPQIEPGAVVVETPVRHIVLASTTFIVYFAMLGLEDSVVGISGCKMVNTPSIAARIHDGRILEVGDGSMSAKSFNMERLFNLQPDLLMIYGTGNPEYDQQNKLQEAGFHVAVNSEYMETTPLGRTEWIKFIAAFFNKDAEADLLFTDIVARYEKLAEKSRNVTMRPTVFCGSNWRGSWHMPGGNSYVAMFLRDAGARYLWSDDQSTGSMPLNVESVIARAKDADFWLNPGVHRSKEEIAGEDDRYPVFRAFRTGRVFNNNAIVDAGGGNDIWETGIANPDKVLADLISIFHPELLPGHQRTWFWQLPEKAIEQK